MMRLIAFVCLLTLTGATVAPTEYTWMEVGVTNGDDGSRLDEKFFVDGALPHDGDVVEIVYVGRAANGNLRFQLRVKR